MSFTITAKPQKLLLAFAVTHYRVPLQDHPSSPYVDYKIYTRVGGEECLQVWLTQTDCSIHLIIAYAQMGECNRNS